MNNGSRAFAILRPPLPDPSRLSLLGAFAGRIGLGRGWLARFVRPVTLWNYVQLLGGSVGRLCISLLYFLTLTRSLSLADFGLFASMVAAGTILARVVGFGYGANLLQVSATRPRALGHYIGVYALWMAMSLPFCLGLAVIVHAAAFSSLGLFTPFLLVIVSDAVIWRVLDAIATINSGLGRFGYAAAVFNVGTGARAGAAVMFLLGSGHDLGHWAWVYLAANLFALLIAWLRLMPRIRVRYRRGTALLRWRSALSLGGAGLASVVQLEIDKLLVLTFGGAATAGLYAICIRVIDLTAVPTRAFNVLMAQRVLKNPRHLAGWRRQVATEMMVAVASVAAFAALLVVVHVWPTALGKDVAGAAALLPLLWAVPALRNLIEYEAELLYARRRMERIFAVSVLLTAIKAALMSFIFAMVGHGMGWVVPMNLVFLVCYGCSALMTYCGRSATRMGPAWSNS